MSRFLILSVIAVFGMCLSVSPLFAHNLLLDCRVSDNRLRVEAFYDDDTPAQLTKVIVEAPGKLVVAEGLTDAKGVWSCPAPPPGEYTVRAQSAGHASHERIKIGEGQVTPSPTTERENTIVESPLIEQKPVSEPRATREEQTETPWLKLVIGIVIIGGGALVWFTFRGAADRP